MEVYPDDVKASSCLNKLLKLKHCTEVIHGRTFLPKMLHYIPYHKCFDVVYYDIDIEINVQKRAAATSVQKGSSESLQKKKNLFKSPEYCAISLCTGHLSFEALL